MGAGAPKGNKNAEKYDIQLATELFIKCLDTSKDTSSNDNDFIGEVAQSNKTTHGTLLYLKDKFPELEEYYDSIKDNCEVNCFRSGKKNDIVPALAIMNLKSNHGWTDRIDNTTKGESTNIPLIDWVD